MKIFTGYCMTIFLLFSFACNEKNDPIKWDSVMAKNQISEREDSKTWDSIMFASDIRNMVNISDLPMISGVFPVPHYDRVGKNSFKGVGNFGYPGGDGAEIKVNDKSILYNSSFAGTNFLNAQFTSGKKNEVFFHIILLTDTVDTTNYSHTGSEIISRNHPNYIGQGFYRTKSQKIEYMAFQTADRRSYAIVNMRLFDLTLGKTILIAPQADATLRSMQIDSPALSSEEIEAYTDSLIHQPVIRNFFTQKGAI